MEFRVINYTTAINFLLPRHYSGRKPPIKWAFGWYDGNKLMAVCTFGKPASNTLCDGVCGKLNSKYVYELNRLCREDDLKQPLSQFVAECLRYLKSQNIIVVSYSDTAMNHHGYIYQACNFLYTGATRERTEKWTPGNKHSRHYDNDEQGEFRKVRSSKHRYVYFCTNSKVQRRNWEDSLRYKIQNYPKGDNSNYILGNYLQPTLVRRVEKKECTNVFTVEQ